MISQAAKSGLNCPGYHLRFSQVRLPFFCQNTQLTIIRLSVTLLVLFIYFIQSVTGGELTNLIKWRILINYN